MSDSTLPASVKFHYLKSNLFRVIHVDGAIGGVTPTRNIFVSVFSQRGALPRFIEQGVLPDGKLGAEVAREGKEGIVREMEIGLTISQDVAKDLAQFLLDQVKLLEQSRLEGMDHSEGEAPDKAKTQ